MADGAYRVVVIGAGFGGLTAAESLRQRGIDFAVYEKADDVGGTWRENTYPGLYVDVPSREYEFPFRPNYDWSRKFAPAPEIQAYIRKVTDELGLRRFIKFNEEIVSARFEDGRWRIVTAKGQTDIADAIICATGFLREPIYPDIEGRDSFAGPTFHSARWDHGVEIAGKRWGVIGGGASGVQITEALAYAPCEVTQFIRRAQWVWIRENPHTTRLERVLARLPFSYRRVQKKLWDAKSAADQWRLEPGTQRQAMERQFEEFLAAVKDPELRRKLKPDYHLGCTRIPKSDRNYYEAVQKPNVHIEKGRIESILPRGVVMADGTQHDLDVLVYATGFDAHAYMRPMKVTGLNGLTVDELWKDSIFSYRGIALPGFPNLFVLFGPFSPVNNVSVPLGLVQEMNYILRVLDMARDRRSAVMPTAAATEKFVARMRDALPGTVWVGCDNWYQDQQGIPILWPLPQDDHIELLADVDTDELEFVPVGEPALA